MSLVMATLRTDGIIECATDEDYDQVKGFFEYLESASEYISGFTNDSRCLTGDDCMHLLILTSLLDRPKYSGLIKDLMLGDAVKLFHDISIALARYVDHQNRMEIPRLDWGDPISSLVYNKRTSYNEINLTCSMVNDLVLNFSRGGMII